MLRADQRRAAARSEHERIPRVRARVGEGAQRVVVPTALQIERAIDDADRYARATRRDLLVERARILAAFGYDQPATREDRRELAREEVALDERGGGQTLGDPNVRVDVDH